MEDTAGSSIVILTLGKPRVPGMSRENLFISGEPYGIQPFYMGEGSSAIKRYPFIGLPVRLEKNGIKEIYPIRLDPDEQKQLCSSAT